MNVPHPPADRPLHRPWPQAAGPDRGDVVVLTPQDAGWTYCGLRVLALEPGVPRIVQTGDSECFVLPLAGALTVQVAHAGQPDTVEQTTEPTVEQEVERTFELIGRESVFTRVTDTVYVGRDSVLQLVSAAGAEVALPSAVCTTRLEARYQPAEEVPVELRGAGPATRQVNNFGVPGVWEHAEKLIAVEVLTPPGSWSSYPAHKHDASDPCPLVIEEIYYYRIGGPDQVTPSRQGFGTHRTYTGPEHDAAGLAPIDLGVDVRDHDVVVVPHGYHGPCVAAPGYPMYYLNVMAGPASERAWAFCDDPAHAWLRAAWDDPAFGDALDPRLPLTTATGRRDGRVADTSTTTPTPSLAPRPATAADPAAGRTTAPEGAQ